MASRRPVTQIPHGEVLGSYRTHEDAQKAVRYLAESEFDVSSLTIVGSDLKIVEPVTGMLTWAAAAGRGALSGAWVGMLFGLVFMLLGGGAEASLTTGALLPGIVIGVGLGMIWGIAVKAINRKQGAIMSSPQVLARTYDIICPPGVLNEAREILATR
ncbi:general stress protein [Brevibacterium otitidis]|uniref:General stress protein n=1 Tax=Brevibacterium otitidis TaxID=53364 RepID=A0ABV5X516_9MICO